MSIASRHTNSKEIFTISLVIKRVGVIIYEWDCINAKDYLCDYL